MANYQSTHTGAQIDAGVDKANKALVKPDSAPSSTSLIAVDNSNTQTMLTIGDGLSIENGALKATGGGGGASIGGGYTINTQWDGAVSTSNFLILGKRVVDGVYGFHNYSDEKYDIGGKEPYNIPIYTNVSIIIPLDWSGSSFYIGDYSALKAYDGTVLTASNRDNYINKICYLTKNCLFHEYD